MPAHVAKAGFKAAHYLMLKAATIFKSWKVWLISWLCVIAFDSRHRTQRSQLTDKHGSFENNTSKPNTALRQTDKGAAMLVVDLTTSSLRSLELWHSILMVGVACYI